MSIVLPPDEGPAILPMQPTPIGLTVSHVTSRDGSTTVTCIQRTWSPGDTGRCRLCPRAQCNPDRWGTCLVTVVGHVPIESAALFSLADWQARDGCAGPGVDVPADG